MTSKFVERLILIAAARSAQEANEGSVNEICRGEGRNKIGAKDAACQAYLQHIGLEILDLTPDEVELVSESGSSTD